MGYWTADKDALMSQTQVYMSIGLAVFVIVVLTLGFKGYRKTRTMADFAIGGRALGPVSLGLAFAATYLSAATFVGYVGWAYSWGLSTLWIFLTLILASPMGLILVAKKIRGSAVGKGNAGVSLPDWLGNRYGSDFMRVAVALITLLNLFYIGAQLSAGALIFNQLLQMPYSIGLVLIAVIVTAYTYGGGTFADVYTDAFQAVLLAVGAVLVFVSALWVFPGDGLTGVMETVTQRLADRGPQNVSLVNQESGIFYSVPAIIGAFVMNFSFSTQPHLFNKVLALKRPRDMAKMISAYVVTVLACLLVIFGGLYAAVARPGLDNPDSALFAYLEVAFPPIVIAFIGIVVLAAAMSTSDGLFVVISTSVANDLYKKYLVPKGRVKTPKNGVEIASLRLSRIVTVLTGVLATLLVLRPPEFIGTFIWLGISGVGAGTLGPVIVGLFFPRLASAAAAKISVGVGLGSYGIIYLAGFEASPLAAGAWAVLIGLAAMFVAGLIFRNPVPVDKKIEPTSVAGGE